jgi:hypothetical protein
MRQTQLSIPEVAFIAGTRGALGAGLGLLLSGRIPKRRAIGWALVAIGALTTIPAAKRVFGRSTSSQPGTMNGSARGEDIQRSVWQGV